MDYFTKNSLENLPTRHRVNLINTITGYKSANLIGTKSVDGQTNLALFNSVIHLGSNPALLGFVSRPLTVERHTYDNIKETSCFTINAVNQKMYKQAHHTSAKYPKSTSEFTETEFDEIYKDGFHAPYVDKSPIQIGCRLSNTYEIKENACLLITGMVEHIYVAEKLLTHDFWGKLDEEDIISIVGLDGYALPKIQDRLAYARPFESQKSILDGPQEK